MKSKLELSFPRSSLHLTFTLDGVFAFPEEWKTTDEANPGIFGYVARTSTIQIPSGKIYPRELTEKEKLQEESKKKGGKKEAKKEQPADNGKSPEQLQQEQQEERKRLEQWNKLSEEEKFYRSSEDQFKSPTLKFQHKQKGIELSGKQLIVFEERVLKDGGDWIYFYKMPIVNEEQLAKIKKSKPKNLNLNDLNPVTMRAWVDLSALVKSNQISQRCKIEQVDKTEDSPEPNLEKTYIKVSFKLHESLLVKKDPYQIETIIKDPPEPKPIPPEEKCVTEMKEELKIALESLAMEYSTMFWKQLNMNEQQKQNQIFGGNKKNQHTKRKEHFLYDFNVSGKYKILKERIKRTIVHLCQHKYKEKMDGEKSFTGISCSVKDQFYSEIYNFLVESYSDVIKDLINEKKQKLGQVQVPSEKAQKQNVARILDQYKKETTSERLNRILGEYELINNHEYGEQLFRKLMDESPDDFELGFRYAIFCIKNDLKTINEVTNYIEVYLQNNKENKKAQLTFILLAIANENSEMKARAWVILRQLIEEDPLNVEFLCYAHLVLESLGNEQCSSKYIEILERAYLRKAGKVSETGKHQEAPSPSEIPSISSLATFEQALQQNDRNELWIKILESFIEYGLVWMNSKIKPKLTNEESISWKKLRLKSLLQEKKYDDCIEEAMGLFDETKEFLILEILIEALGKAGRTEQLQKYLKIALRICPQNERPKIFFKLGYFYINQKKYGNAKACLVNYIEVEKNLGGLSWELLGMAELKCGNATVSVECLRHANLSNPYNGAVWGLLAESYAQLGNLIMVNQCLNSYEAYTKVPLKETYERLERKIEQKIYDSFYDYSLKKSLAGRLQKVST